MRKYINQMIRKGQLDILPNDEPAEVQKLVGIVDDNDV